MKELIACFLCCNIIGSDDSASFQVSPGRIAAEAAVAIVSGVVGALSD